MNKLNYHKQIELAAEQTLSGASLAARWRLRQSKQHQQMMQNLWQHMQTVEEREAVRIHLQSALGISLQNAICQYNEQIITWLAKDTRAILAMFVRLGDSFAQQLPAPKLATLGTSYPVGQQVVRQDVDQSEDGSLEWQLTFVVDSKTPQICVVEASIDMFDRFDLSGVRVYLHWDNEQRQGETDARGIVCLQQIPVDKLGHISVTIVPPQKD